METTLIVRIILILLSTLSIVLQIIGVVGRAWYGFSLTIEMQQPIQLTVTEHIEGGLFHFSPLQVCIDQGNGTECMSQDQFPPELKPLMDVANNAVHESFVLLKFLSVTGLILSGCGMVLLYIYLCIQSKRHRCTGIVCAIIWILAALVELVATGIQVSRNNDTKHSFDIVETAFQQQNMHITGKMITAWAPIVLGIGAAWSVVVGLVVALTTCGKKFSKTVIIYRELRDKEGLMLDQDSGD